MAELKKTSPVTKETTPDEIRELADSYEAMMKASGLPLKKEATIAEMEARVAALNDETVEAWKARFESAAVAEAVAPVKKKAPVKKVSRGAPGIIDRDYFFMTTENQSLVAKWIQLRQEMAIPMNMLVVGPSGCGKTESFTHLGRQFGKPVYKVDCASITTPDKWVGHKELVATEQGQETHYVKSQFLQWLAAEGCEPGIVVLDELNRISPLMLNTLIPILDGSQKIWIPDLGIFSEVHKDTMIAATANLGVGYSGTHALDIALFDRFGTIMETTFPPREEEITVLCKRTGVDEENAGLLVDIGRQCRSMADAGDLSKYVSTRGLIDAAFFVAAGATVANAASWTFVKKFSAEGRGESEQAKVTLVVTGKSKSK